MFKVKTRKNPSNSYLKLFARRSSKRLWLIICTYIRHIYRYANLVLLIMVLGFLTVGGVNPQVQQWMIAASADFGINLQKILIDKLDKTSEKEILAALQVYYGQPLLGLNLQLLKQKIATLPWIKAVTIERRLPSTLYIKLVERKEIARWQYQQAYYLIDQDGAIIKDIPPQQQYDYQSLPIVVGSGANVHAAELLANLSQFPQILKAIEGASFIGGRRWNLILTRNIQAKMPEIGYESALAHLEMLLQKHNLLAKEIESIDLRQEGKVIIRLTPGGALKL